MGNPSILSLLLGRSIAPLVAGIGTLGAMVFGASAVQAQTYLDITSLTTGNQGSFTGTVGGVGVTGSLNATNGFFTINGAGGTYENSVVNGTSPQYSYSSVYTPTIAGVDQLGYTMFFGSTGTATLTLNFAQAITDPVFHFANIDSAMFTFAQSGGLNSLTLLSGNGGNGDGLIIGGGGFTLQDANPNTIVAAGTNATPATTGARSAYGSVMMNGNISTLTVTIARNPGTSNGGDGGNFTISTNGPANVAAAPEPGTIALLLTAGVPVVGLVRRRKKVAATA